MRDPSFQTAVGPLGSEAGSSDPADADFSPARYPFAFVTRVSSRYNADLTKQLRRIGLDQPSWRILMILLQQDRASVSELVERTAVKQPTVTRILQRMRRSDLITMASRPDDMRVYEVSITPTGRLAADKARPLASAAFRRGTQGLSAADIEALIQLLTRMESNYAR